VKNSGGIREVQGKMRTVNKKPPNPEVCVYKVWMSGYSGRWSLLRSMLPIVISGLNMEYIIEGALSRECRARVRGCGFTDSCPKRLRKRASIIIC